MPPDVPEFLYLVVHVLRLGSRCNIALRFWA